MVFGPKRPSELVICSESAETLFVKRFYSLALTALAVAVNATAAVFSSQRETYGLTLEQTEELESAAFKFNTAINDLSAAKQAVRAAAEYQNAARQRLLAALSSCAGTMYINPSITDDLVAAAGFPPHETGRTHHSPHIPLNLEVMPFVNGRVKLKWKKGANRYGAVYVVEARIGDEDWKIITHATRPEVTLSGFEPGQEVWFRVYASRNGQVSVPSQSVVIYPKKRAAGIKQAA